MLTLFSGAALLVTVVCVIGLVAHFLFMKRRTKFEEARTKLRSLLDDPDSAEDDIISAEEEYEIALGEYNAYVSHGLGAAIGFLVGLGVEGEEDDN